MPIEGASRAIFPDIQEQSMKFKITVIALSTSLALASLAGCIHNNDTETQSYNLPDFKHLPVLVDKDGDPNDNQGTYTLKVESNVQVPVNTPDDNWITPMLRYNGSALPPVIRAKRGDVMTFPVTNNLDKITTVHWHGFKIPGDQDGGPDFPIAAGDSHTYSFTINQPAASLWFHPHPHEKTGEQVYRGLAGVFLVDDEISRQLEADKQLPAGDYDIPLLIQDRRFKDDHNDDRIRELAYKTHTRDTVLGQLGDIVLVNGVQLPKLEVESRKYRFRIYNTSNARTLDIALNDGASFHVVGTDGGLLPEPVETKNIVLGAAERAEIVIDFSRYDIDEKVMLISRAFNGGSMMDMNGGMGRMGGMMNMMSSSDGMDNDGMDSDDVSEMANGKRFDIMRFDITTAASDDITLYTRLPDSAEIHSRLSETDATATREFVMSMGGMGSGMQFLINDKSFDMNRVDEQVDAGATEIWAISNTSPMAHPFHAHAIQWQILDRNGTPASGVDLGWKDTVLVQPGETVRFIGRFDPVINSGKYMYHCHILEHEDAGMMGTFVVQ